MPIFLAVLTAVGLLAGLSGDGLADVLSWLGLAVPAAICVWALWFRNSPRGKR